MVQYYVGRKDNPKTKDEAMRQVADFVYNVFKYHKEVKDFDTFVENVLKAYMAGCARAFERLPILANAELLRNIIYSGVWTKFYAARRKRNNTAGKQLEEHNDRSI